MTGPSSESEALWRRDWRILSLLLALLAAGLLAISVSLSYYASSRQAFQASKSAEKLSVLRMVDAMMLTYTDLRDSRDPVPATFQARVIQRFHATAELDHDTRLAWVGLPDRYIRTGPADPQMAAWMMSMAGRPAPKPETRQVEIGGERLLRSVFPSVANHDSCLTCHNEQQKHLTPWRLGDTMGALVLDVPIGAFLDRLLLESVLLGVALFGTVFAVGAALRWIGLRRLAGDAERRLHGRFAEAIESMPDGFALYDEHGACVLANSAYRRRAAGRADTAGAPAGPGSDVRQDADGSWIKSDSALTSSGLTVRLQTDITTLKKREADLEAAREIAEQASRSRGDFLALMSHELRTPLNAIIGFSEVMRDRLLGDLLPRYREYAADINDSGRHLLTIISDILDLAKAEAGKLVLAEEQVDLADLIEACRRIMSGRLADAGITLTVTVPPLQLRADPVKLKQVVINILSNAAKFTPAGGRIDIAATADAAGLRLVIADTGIGIAAEDLPRVMEPFVQVDPHRQGGGGTGLGLPLARKLTELHGGAIRVDSKPGHGTTVTVSLPGHRLLPDHLAALQPYHSAHRLAVASKA